MSYTPAITLASGLFGPVQPAMLFGLTLSEWGTVAMGASSLMSGVNMVSGAMQQEAAADASAKAAEQNAMQARAESERNAAAARVKAERERKLAQQQFEREQSSRTAWLGKYGSGGDSQLEVLAGAAEAFQLDLESMDYTSRMDQDTILYGGETAARGYSQQAGQYRTRAQNAMTSMPWNVGQTLLEGGAKTYRYYKGQ